MNTPPIEPVASLPTTINARRRGFSPSLKNARQGEHVVPLGACVRLKHDYYVVGLARFATGRDAGDRDNRCAKKRKTATWFHYEIQRRGAERRGDVLASRLSPTLLRMLSSGIDTTYVHVHVESSS